MKLAARRLRTRLAGVVIAGGALGVIVAPQGDTLAADTDLFAFNATANLTPGLALTLSPSTVSYSFATGAACMSTPLPSPASTSVSGYLDVPADESGGCGVSGGGTLSDVVACSTGLISASWVLTEPLGDTATLTAGGVLVGGVAVVAGAPPSGGFVDGTSTLPTAGVGVGVFLPTTGQSCRVGGITSFDATAAVAGAY